MYTRHITPSNICPHCGRTELTVMNKHQALAGLKTRWERINPESNESELKKAIHEIEIYLGL